MRITITSALVAVSLFLLPACPGEEPSGNDGGVADAATDGGGTTDAGSDGGESCATGETDLCGCPDGSISEKVCQADAAWGACRCGGPCAAGEHDGGGGICVPEGSCSTGFHDSGDGSCAAEGLCILGFHDGGDGACVPEGECGAGFRIGEGGVCGPPMPCSGGFVARPHPLDFGPWPVGETVTRSFAVTNTSEYDSCPLAQVALAAGSDPAFVLPGAGTFPASLGPQESMEVEVRFAPTTEGRQTAVLGVILDNPQSTYMAMRITGEGFTFSVSMDPTALDFGTATLDCQPPSQTVCLQNDSSIAVELSRTVFSEPGFALVSMPPLPAVIAVGAELCFGIAFRPAFVGASSSVLQIAITPGGTPLYVDLVGEAVDSIPVTETLVQGAAPKADLLWVVSGSSITQSIEPELVTLGDELIAHLTARGVDYQVGVVSTDPVTAPTPGLLEPFDRLGPHLVTPALASPGQAAVDNLFSALSGAAGLDNGFEVARLALSAPLHTDPALNGGFVRPDASLALIMLSTGDDSSPDPDSDYRDFFAGLHGEARPELFSVSAIAGPAPFGCPSPGGPVPGAPRLSSMASLTGGHFGDICDPLQRSQALTGLVASFGLPSRFPLGQAADAAGTITVEIADAAGNLQPATGWSYDPGANAIDFEVSSTPQPGESVVIAYSAACN